MRTVVTQTVIVVTALVAAIATVTVVRADVYKHRNKQEKQEQLLLHQPQ